MPNALHRYALSVAACVNRLSALKVIVRRPSYALPTAVTPIVRRSSDALLTAAER